MKDSNDDSVCFYMKLKSMKIETVILSLRYINVRGKRSRHRQSYFLVKF